MEKKKPKKKRHPPVPWRIPAGREAEFHALVERAKLSANGFITSMVFSEKPLRQSRRSTIGEKLAGRAIGILGQIKEELRALRRDLADEEDESAMHEKYYELLVSIDKRLTEIRWALFKLLRRKP